MSTCATNSKIANCHLITDRSWIILTDFTWLKFIQNYVLRVFGNWTKIVCFVMRILPAFSFLISNYTLTPGWIRGFSRKKSLNARGFVREYLHSCSGYGPGRIVKRRDKSSSLHSKKNFLLGGCGFFVSDIISWGLLATLAHFPVPGHQPLGGSISLKFLLETRQQSESFDTLDDLLGFQVQKLWSELVKIFD